MNLATSSAVDRRMNFDAETARCEQWDAAVRSAECPCMDALEALNGPVRGRSTACPVDLKVIPTDHLSSFVDDD